MPFLHDFKLREPEDATDIKLLDDIQNFGFHIVGIAEDGDLAKLEYAFTVGCYYSFGIPEVVLHGMKFESSHALIHNFVRWAKEAKSISDYMIVPDIANIPLLLRPVDITWYQPLLGYGIWFYRELEKPFPCMQLAWPDPNGKFDFDPDFLDKYRSIQPDLSAPSTSA